MTTEIERMDLSKWIRPVDLRVATGAEDANKRVLPQPGDEWMPPKTEAVFQFIYQGAAQIQVGSGPDDGLVSLMIDQGDEIGIYCELTRADALWLAARLNALGAG